MLCHYFMPYVYSTFTLLALNISTQEDCTLSTIHWLMPCACHIPTIVPLTEQEHHITTDKATGANTPQVQDVYRVRVKGGEVKINRCVKECGKQTFCFALKWLCSLSLSSHTTDLMYLFFLSCTKHVFQQETFYRQCIHSYSHNHAFVCLCIFVSNIA